MSLILPALALSIFPMPLVAKAGASIPEVYRQVALRFGIPAVWLYSIALTESGRSYKSKHRPWPWTLNIKGESFYFDNQSQAGEKLKQTLQRTSLIDVGLMQINWHWHSNRLRTAADALNPINNLAIGATILAEQCQLCGNWPEAVGRYHSPGTHSKAKKRAQDYRVRVQKQAQAL